MPWDYILNKFIIIHSLFHNINSIYNWKGWIEIFSITIELVIGFIILFIVTKAIGKTQINQLTPFDFISALVMGELLGNAIYDKEVSIFLVLYALVLWGLLMITVELLSQKILKTRKFLDGKPAIVIRNGIIDYKELKKNRININTLQQLLRQKDIFSIRDVEYAILESSGTLSVLKKYGVQGVIKDDINAQVKAVNLPITLISDGQILWENLKRASININYLKNEIEKEGYQGIEDIFYAEWLEGSGLLLQSHN